jgi:hypothetical protein
MAFPHDLLGNGCPSMQWIAYLDDAACYVNLRGDYRYMTSGYYTSQDWEAVDKPVHPTCKEILDAYIVPLFLERARLAGVKIPAYYITNDFFEPPVIVDSINPFMSRQSIVLRSGHQERVSKSLTRNFTYAICCQELPVGARIGHFRAVLGWSVRRRYRPLAAAIWEIFRVPLARVRVIMLANQEVLLSGLRPLPCERLSVRERDYVQKRVTWLT